jgi:hypothetical protein
MLSTSTLGLSEAPEFGRRTSLGCLEPRFSRRGLTLEELEEYGLVHGTEQSTLFEGIPITEEEIGKLPKKVQREKPSTHLAR